MKVELPAQRPGHIQEFWPGVYDLFSYYEFAAGMPNTIFLITTLKENSKANACLHSWSGFGSDDGRFFAVMPSLMAHTHTYKNILRDKEFCVNFLPARYAGAFPKTIEHNGDDVDELEAAGLHAEPAKLVKPPRIAEAFISYECKLHSHQDITGAGQNALVIGEVIHAVAEDSLRTPGGICSEDAFVFNIHSPIDPTTGRRTGEDDIAHLTLTKQ